METTTVMPSVKRCLATSVQRYGINFGNGQNGDTQTMEKDGVLTDTLRLEAKDGNLLVRSTTAEAKLKKLAYLT